MVHLSSTPREVTNRWVYPVLTAVAANYLFIQCSDVTLFIFLFALLRLLCTGNHRLICWGFLCCLATLCAGQFVLRQERIAKQDLGVLSQQLLRIEPHTIKVDGDLLQLSGLLTSVQGQQRVQASYQLSSEEEQEWWSEQRQVVEMVVSGTLEVPQGRVNLNGFDYGASLRHKQIYQRLNIEQVHQRMAMRLSLLNLKEAFSWLRRQVVLFCEERLAPATAFYTQLLLFGEKGQQEEWVESFAALGIVHLFSLSGLQCSFVYKKCRSFLLYLGVSIESSFWLLLVLSFVYAGIAGFSVSVVRALVQKNLTAAWDHFQLPLSALDTWSATLFLAVLANPFLLLTMAGQYSYFIAFCIVYLAASQRRRGRTLVQRAAFSGLLSLCTIPLVSVTSYEWFPLSIILSVFLSPFFERVLLPVLSINLVTAMIPQSDRFSQILEQLLLQLNGLFEWVNQASIPSFAVGKAPLLLFFLGVLSVQLLLHGLAHNKALALVAASMLLLLLHQAFFFQGGIVAFIDVGQGDSIFIQAPHNGETVLIDTGGRIGLKKEGWAVRKNQKSGAEYTVIPFLKSRGVKHLDKVFVTHSDVDHMGDLLAISNKMPISHLYFSDGGEQQPEFLQALKVVQRQGTKLHPTKALTEIPGKIPLTVLAPAIRGNGSNNDSLVLYAKIQGTRFLFTGDLEEAGEAQLLETFDGINADVLKIGHHGSRTSTSTTFLDALQPRDAVISCGRKNRFGHPHEEVLERLLHRNIHIYRTDQQGMIYYQWPTRGEALQAHSVLPLNE